MSAFMIPLFVLAIGIIILMIGASVWLRNQP